MSKRQANTSLDENRRRKTKTSATISLQIISALLPRSQKATMPRTKTLTSITKHLNLRKTFIQNRISVVQLPLLRNLATEVVVCHHKILERCSPPARDLQQDIDELKKVSSLVSHQFYFLPTHKLTMYFRRLLSYISLPLKHLSTLLATSSSSSTLLHSNAISRFTANTPMQLSSIQRAYACIAIDPTPSTLRKAAVVGTLSTVRRIKMELGSSIRCLDRTIMESSFSQTMSDWLRKVQSAKSDPSKLRNPNFRFPPIRIPP